MKKGTIMVVVGNGEPDNTHSFNIGTKVTVTDPLEDKEFAKCKSDDDQEWFVSKEDLKYYDKTLVEYKKEGLDGVTYYYEQFGIDCERYFSQQELEDYASSANDIDIDLIEDFVIDNFDQVVEEMFKELW